MLKKVNINTGICMVALTVTVICEWTKIRICTDAAVCCMGLSRMRPLLWLTCSHLEPFAAV